MSFATKHRGHWDNRLVLNGFFYGASLELLIKPDFFKPDFLKDHPGHKLSSLCNELLSLSSEEKQPILDQSEVIHAALQDVLRVIVTTPLEKQALAIFDDGTPFPEVSTNPEQLLKRVHALQDGVVKKALAQRGVKLSPRAEGFLVDQIRPTLISVMNDLDKHIKAYSAMSIVADGNSPPRRF